MEEKLSKLGVGVDFGTTNSVAAFFDGNELALVDLENAGAVMPSATYIDQALQTKTGKNAIDQYIADNTGRTVELVPEVIGETSKFSENDSTEEPSEVDTVTEQIYGAPITDSGLQGRLFRGTKRLLGDERVRRLMVFNQPFRLVALITPILLRIRKAIEKQVGPIELVHIGHPVNFEGKEKLRSFGPFPIVSLEQVRKLLEQDLSLIKQGIDPVRKAKEERLEVKIAAEKFIQTVTTNDVSKIRSGQAQYSAICNNDGCIIDDIIVYKLRNSFMLVINASGIDKKYNWLKSKLFDGVNIENKSSDFSMIALQGPKSKRIIQSIINNEITKLKFYSFIENIDCLGHNVLLSRTGYTGELGFEIYCKNE